MTAFSSIALGIAAAASVASTAYTIKSSEDAKAQGEAQMAEQKKQQDQALKDLETEKRTKEKQDAAVRQNTEQVRATRARRGYSGTLGRGSTILTGPLGLTSAAPASGGVAKKTILGA